MKRAYIEHPKLIVVAVIISFITACSSTHSDDVQSRIAAVENSLIPAVINAGSEPAGMSLSDRMQHYQVPGVGIAVINDGRIEWAKGYGVTEAGGSQAVSPDTLFQACSISKPVSVTGIMLLAQSGAIDISRNVNDYLRSWRLADNAFTMEEKATVRRLMSHRAEPMYRALEDTPQAAPHRHCFRSSLARRQRQAGPFKSSRSPVLNTAIRVAAWRCCSRWPKM